MKRGRTFITLDMPEAATVAFSLRDELHRLDLALKRDNVPDGLPEAVACTRELFDRIRNKLASAGVGLPL